MPWWAWIAVLALFLVAGAAIWFRFGNPKWVAGLVTAFISMAINALLPVVLKRMDPETEAKWREAMKQGRGWDYQKNRPKDLK